VKYLGIDWAEHEHAICLLDEQGERLAERTIPDTLAGYRVLQELVAEHAAEPEQVVIGIETEQGMLARVLRVGGYQLYAINPVKANRYRERHKTSGAKSDPADAKMLADLVRTDRHNHRMVAENSDEVSALQVLTRAHQRLIWDRQRHCNRLRSTLRLYHPGMLAALVKKDLYAADSLALVQAAPTPQQGRQLRVDRIERVLRSGGRARGIRTSAEKIAAALRCEQAPVSSIVAAAFGVEVAALVRLIGSLNGEIASLEETLGQQFEKHPDAEIILSLPGLKTVLGARVLAEFGDDPNRYANSKARKCYAGTAPITRSSGLSRFVAARETRNSRLLDACFQWARNAKLTSPGARRYYEQRKEKGKTHNQAVRALANRLVGILHGCLLHRGLYEEATAWPVWEVLAEGASEPTNHHHKPLESTGGMICSQPTLAASI